MNFPLEGNCKFLRAVNVHTLYVLLQGFSEVLALSTIAQEIAVSTAAPCAARWRHLQWLWVCWRGHEKTSSHSVMDLLGDLHFPHGLSPGKDTAGTCLWHQILGKSNVTVVLAAGFACPRALESEGYSCIAGWCQRCRTALPKRRSWLFKQQQSLSYPLSGCMNNKPKPCQDAQLHTFCSSFQGRTGPATTPHPWVWQSFTLLVLSRSLELAQFTLLLIQRQLEYVSILRSEQFGHICIRFNNKHLNHQGIFCHTSFPAQAGWNICSAQTCFMLLTSNYCMFVA